MAPLPPTPKTPSGTAQRLGWSLAALVLLFSLTSGFALWHLREIHPRLVQMQAQQRTMRTTLEAATAIRDAYAHQAHTLILGNATHVHLYDTSARRVRELTGALREGAESDEERAWVRDIEAAQAAMDRNFHDALVPAVLARDAAAVEAGHNRVLALVARMEERTGRLVERHGATLDALEQRVDHLHRVAFLWVLLLLASAPALAAVLGVYVYRSVARPLQVLHAGARRLAEGDMGARIALDTRDEFGALARQLNAMTVALGEHQERLVQSEKLAGIGRLAAGVAHELNNPLTVMLGYLKLMRKKASPELGEDLRVLEEEALRSKDIVEGLLDLSRPLAFEPRPVDLRALCDEAVARLREAGQLAGASVRVEGAAQVAGHPLKLGQVVTNLVKNAAEATGAGGEVVVRLAATPAGAELHVSDNGPGLSPRARERLFEPFSTTKPHGTGLGLAVSQGIVRAHGGDISVEPDGAPGAHFVVRLPPAAGAAVGRAEGA